MKIFIIPLLSYYVFAQEETIVEFTSGFTSAVVDTPTPSTYKPYQAQLDKSDQTSKTILLSVVADSKPPTTAEFGTVDLAYNNYPYTTLYGDVTAGSSAGIVDGKGKAARIIEIRCFTQTADGATIYFGDQYVLRKVDRASGNVSSLLGDSSISIGNFTSWDSVTFKNINGIVYDDVTGFLYINADSKGLVAFDLPNKKFSIVIPLAEISSPDSNDYGADLIISPDRKLYMKVSQGVNRYSLSDINDINTDKFNLVDTRWISSIDRNATYRERNYTFGSTFFGRLGLSPTGRLLSMVDYEQNYLYFIDICTGIVNRICGRGSFSDGDTSVCSFTEPFSSLWIPDDFRDKSNPDGTLYLFHYYSASRSKKNNYVSVATLKDYGPLNPPTTTITPPTTTTTVLASSISLDNSTTDSSLTTTSTISTGIKPGIIVAIVISSIVGVGGTITIILVVVRIRYVKRKRNVVKEKEEATARELK